MTLERQAIPFEMSEEVRIRTAARIRTSAARGSEELVPARYFVSRG